MKRIPSTDQLLDCKFNREKVNELWVTHIKEPPTREGKVFARQFWPVQPQKCRSGFRFETALDLYGGRSRYGCLVPHINVCWDCSRRPFRPICAQGVHRKIPSAHLLSSFGMDGEGLGNARKQSLWSFMQTKFLDRGKVANTRGAGQRYIRMDRSVQQSTKKRLLTQLRDTPRIGLSPHPTTNICLKLVALSGNQTVGQGRIPPKPGLEPKSSPAHLLSGQLRIHTNCPCARQLIIRPLSSGSKKFTGRKSHALRNLRMLGPFVSDEFSVDLTIARGLVSVEVLCLGGRGSETSRAHSNPLFRDILDLGTNIRKPKEWSGCLVWPLRRKWPGHVCALGTKDGKVKLNLNRQEDSSACSSCQATLRLVP